MSAPTGISHAARWQAWTTTWAYLLAPDAPGTTDTAVTARPLGAGDQLTTHNDRTVSWQGTGTVVEEDVQHDRVMPAAN